MPQHGTNEWTDKRERQYEHIRDSLEDRGRSEDTAEEIAARTVNTGPGGRTYRQLYAEAKRKGIEGRSKMSKKQLENAVGG